MTNPDSANPTWDNSQEYSSLDAPELTVDLERLEEISKELMKYCSQLPLDESQFTDSKKFIPLSQQVSKLKSESVILSRNITTFAQCYLHTNTKDTRAEKLFHQSQEISSKLNESLELFHRFMAIAPQSFLKEHLNSLDTKADHFLIAQLSNKKSHLLTASEEQQLQATKRDGFHAWEQIYRNISDSLKCEVEVDGEKRTVGTAHLTGLLSHSDGHVRKQVFLTRENTWKTVQNQCATIINSISGFRLQENLIRSSKKPRHFLDGSLYENRLCRETLDAMISAVTAFLPTARKVPPLRARASGKETAHIWDQMAPAPATGDSETIDFTKAFSWVSSAYERLDPTSKEFIQMMKEKKWIEAGNSENRRTGAYSTTFYKTRTPRVYMTFLGGLRDTSILAHELGHAYHSWLMRDLPVQYLRYPMSLAECASLFGEILLSDFLLEDADNEEQKFRVMWNNATNASIYILGVLNRFQFEYRLYERRQHGVLQADELNQLSYETEVEINGGVFSSASEMNWARVPHFYFTGNSFYNYPYMFGYLFSLGLFRMRQQMGTNFFQAYQNLLRDTGSMTVEDLAQKHLNVDLRQETFWKESLKIVEQHINEFEQAVNARFTA